MSSDLAIKNKQLKLLQENNFLFPDEDCNIIIPYLPSGYKDYSNNGYVQGQKLIDNYLTYKRIWTGNDAFTITWKGSTYITKDPDSNINLKINWQLGEYILGYNESHYSSVDITDDSALTDYKKTVAENTITFRIRADKYDLNENYKYMFYKVPEISNNIIYRVVSLDTEYIGRTKVCYVLTLKSLQQELENTGRARQQNIMNSAPGSGYYDPLIIENENFKPTEQQLEKGIYQKIDRTRWLTYNQDYFINNPVKKVVVKAFGLCWFNSFSCVGRRVSKYDDMTTYQTQSLIFPIEYVQASTPTLYRTQTAEDNYYWLTAAVNINFTDEAYNKMKDFLEINKVWPSQGIIEWDGTPENTNQKTGDVYRNTLYGNAVNIAGEIVYKPWRFDITNEKTYDNSGVFGCENVCYMSGKDRAIHDYNWAAYWCHKAYSVIPLGKENTITFGNMVGGGLQTIMGGGVANVIAGAFLFCIGILGSMFNKVANKNIKNGISGMIPAKLFEFMKSEASASLGNSIAGTSWAKLSYLMNSEENDFIKFFNTSTMNTSFQAELTDLFVKDNKTYWTAYIGQERDEKGNNIKPDGRALWVNGKESLQKMPDDNVGFIIDSFNIQAIYDGDYSVEFLNDKDEVVWSAIIQSQARWSGSIRQWNTWQDTSIYGRENVFLDDPLPWPEYPQIPNLQEGKNIDMDINAEFKIFNSKEYESFTFNEIAQQFDGGYQLVNGTTYVVGTKTYHFFVYDSNKNIVYNSQRDNPDGIKFWQRTLGDPNNKQIARFEKNMNSTGGQGWTTKQLIMTNDFYIDPNDFFEIYPQIDITINNGLSDFVISLNKDNWNNQEIRQNDIFLQNSVWHYPAETEYGNYRNTVSVFYVRHNIDTFRTIFLQQPFFTRNHPFYEYKLFLTFDDNKVYLNFEFVKCTFYINSLDSINENVSNQIYAYIDATPNNSYTLGGGGGLQGKTDDFLRLFNQEKNFKESKVNNPSGNKNIDPNNFYSGAISRTMVMRQQHQTTITLINPSFEQPNYIGTDSYNHIWIGLKLLSVFGEKKNENKYQELLKRHLDNLRYNKEMETNQDK